MLVAPIINPVRLANKGHKDIPIRSFIHDHLGMASDHYLTTLGGHGLTEDLIHLPLSEDLKVGVRLIKKEN